MSSESSEDIESFEIVNLVNKIEEAINYNKNFHINSVNYYFKKEDWELIDKIIIELKKNGYNDITRDSRDGEHIIVKWA